jgi:hypothetical protein
MNDQASLKGVITCVVEYVINPAKIDAFERFGCRWMELVDSHGGTHHGYFLPADGASEKPRLFSFPASPPTSSTVPYSAQTPTYRSRPHQGPERLRAPLQTELHAPAAT